MRILVTGGAGFIGSHLVDRLLGRGDEVHVLDDLSTGSMANLQGHVGNDRFHFVNGTILDESLVERMIEPVDTVYHLAATVGVKHVVRDPLRGLLTNVQGTEVVFRTAFRYWKRVLLASTSEVYGKTTRFPFREGDDRVLGDTSVHRWSYSAAKAVDEHIAFAYADRGLPVSIVRYFNSYGPRIDEQGYGSVVAAFIRQALTGEPLEIHGDGSQSRCFTFVEDTVEGTLRAGESEEALGLAFNLGTEEETSVAELARRVVGLTGSSSTLTHVPYERVFGPGFEDTPRRLPCMERCRERLGWEPTWKLDDGLRLTIRWCREHFAGGVTDTKERGKP